MHYYNGYMIINLHLQPVSVTLNHVTEIVARRLHNIYFVVKILLFMQFVLTDRRKHELLRTADVLPVKWLIEVRVDIHHMVINLFKFARFTENSVGIG